VTPCRKCASLEYISVDQAWKWVEKPHWFEPDWWTRRRIDRAMRIRDEMNRAYAEGMCRGLGHDGRDTLGRFLTDDEWAECCNLLHFEQGD